MNNLCRISEKVSTQMHPRKTGKKKKTLANSFKRHPPLFVIPSIASAPFSTSCADSVLYSEDSKVRKPNLKASHMTAEALGLVDLTAHSTSVALLGLTNYTFTLQQLRDMRPNEDLVLRCEYYHKYLPPVLINDGSLCC